MKFTLFENVLKEIYVHYLKNSIEPAWWTSDTSFWCTLQDCNIEKQGNDYKFTLVRSILPKVILSVVDVYCQGYNILKYESKIPIRYCSMPQQLDEWKIDYEHGFDIFDEQMANKLQETFDTLDCEIMEIN